MCPFRTASSVSAPDRPSRVPSRRVRGSVGRHVHGVDVTSVARGGLDQPGEACVAEELRIVQAVSQIDCVPAEQLGVAGRKIREDGMSHIGTRLAGLRRFGNACTKRARCAGIGALLGLAGCASGGPSPLAEATPVEREFAAAAHHLDPRRTAKSPAGVEAIRHGPVPRGRRQSRQQPHAHGVRRACPSRPPVRDGGLQLFRCQRRRPP